MLDIPNIYYQLPKKRRLAFRCFIDFLYDNDALRDYMIFADEYYMSCHAWSFVSNPFETSVDTITTTDFFYYCKIEDLLTFSLIFPLCGRIDWYDLDRKWRSYVKDLF